MAQQLHITHRIHATFFGSRQRTNKTITCVTYSSLLGDTALSAESWPNFPKFSTRPAHPLTDLLLFGHCATAVLVQNGGAPTPLQIQTVPVQGLACCHNSLHAAQACCAPAEGELCYGVTCVYFCTPFNTVVGPPSLLLDEKLHCVCNWQCSCSMCKTHVFPIRRAFRKGTERRKVR